MGANLDLGEYECKTVPFGHSFSHFQSFYISSEDPRRIEVLNLIHHRYDFNNFAAQQSRIMWPSALY